MLKGKKSDGELEFSEFIGSPQKKSGCPGLPPASGGSDYHQPGRKADGLVRLRFPTAPRATPSTSVPCWAPGRRPGSEQRFLLELH